MDLLDFKKVEFLERDTSTPTFGGIIASEIGKGGLVEIILGDERHYVDINPADGSWSWAPTTPLADAHYSFSLRSIDRAGNASVATLRTLVIDTVVPEAPELLNLYDDQGAVTGSFDIGTPIDDLRPGLTGVAQKGSTVYLRDAAGNNIGSAIADANSGVWKMEPAQDLAEGVNNLTLVAVEKFAGQEREGTATAPFVIEVNTSTLPADTITIIDAVDNAGSFVGPVQDGALTDDTTPTLRGDVSKGNTVIVYYRLAGSTMWAGSATADVSGESWSWTPGNALAAGNYEFQASIGNTSSALFNLEIATSTSIEDKVTIDYAFDNVGASTGRLESGALTDDANPTFSGRGEANSRLLLTYTLDGGSAASVVVNVDSSGNWKWTPVTSLASGEWAFTVQVVGSAKISDSFNLEIGNAFTLQPEILFADDNFGRITGHLTSGATTDDSTPTLHGRAEANSVITLRYGQSAGSMMTVTVSVDSRGNWQWAPTANLAEGKWSFETKQATGSSWAKFELIIDANIDVKPTIDYAYDDVSKTPGQLASGAGTSDNTPTLFGTSVRDTLIYIRYMQGGVEMMGSAQVNTFGQWSWTPAELPDGHYQFEVRKAGGQWDSAFELEIDTQPSPEFTRAYDDAGYVVQDLASGDITDDTKPTLYGTATAGSLVYLRYSAEGHAAQLVSFTADAKGEWQWEPKSDLADANWKFEVQRDGQSFWNEFDIQVYTSKVGTNPIITYMLDETTGEHVYNGQVLKDLSPVIYGTGTSNTAFELLVGYTGLPTSQQKIYIVPVGADGTWSFKVPEGVTIPATGSYAELRIDIRNFGENYFSLSPFQAVTKGSAIPVFDSYLDQVGDTKGLLPAGGLTDDDTPTFYGHYEPYKLVYITYRKIGGVSSPTHFSIRADSDGNWEWQAPKLAVGSYTMYAGADNNAYDRGNAHGMIMTITKPGTFSIDETGSDDHASLNDALAAVAHADEPTAEYKTFTLNVQDILSNGQQDIFIGDDKMQLMVQGHEGDVVKLDDILPDGSDNGDWALQAGTVTVAGVEYQVYSHSGEDVELLVQQGVKTELV